MAIPKNEAAELAVISKLLLSGERAEDKLPLVMEMVSPQDFVCYTHKIANSKIIEGIYRLYTGGKKIDAVSMAGIVPTQVYIELMNGAVSSADIKQSCEYVREASQLRKRITVANKILGMCEGGETVSSIDKVFNDMQVVDSKYDLVDAINGYSRYEKYLRANTNGDLLGLSTGIPELDKMTWGFQKNHVWVVGGYRGSGKSFFGLNVVNTILKNGGNVLVFNLEMSNNEFMHRLIALRCGLHLKSVYLRDISEEVRTNKEELLNNWSNERLIMRDDINGLTEIENFIRLMCNSKKVDVVIIDFVQLVNAQGSGIYERMSNVATSLQGIAKKYKITVVMLSQLNNDAVRIGANSDVDGFKGAGELSQVANVAIKIIREKGDNGMLTEMFKLEVVKVRHNFGGDIYAKITFPGGKIGGEYIPPEKPEKKEELNFD
ncbi:DnaB-like helicase C-terminal domain-containing protein [Tenuifilum sp.]|uniref:DnaB-like helicase C-terminal domain-containing protein n=1 Tax=Tenuifilum sp. TaxID=2760880 RepID=UPI002C0EAA02|nr:DnaB-like helicase C-terminal domain-containing protein [Tenuifilum sp.]